MADQLNLVLVKRLSEEHQKAEDIKVGTHVQQDIIKLTRLKAIFLVGGFGSSEYLKQCLQSNHPNIQVIQPHDAWSAIVKWAYLKTLFEESTKPLQGVQS